MIRFTKATAAPPKPKKPTGEKKAALDKLRSFLAQAEPEAAEFLVSFWDSQALGITYAELREAYLAGDLPPQRYRQWTQEYSSFIQDRLAPAWRQAADAGAAEIRAKYPHFVYEPSMGAAMDYIRHHGAELVTNITAEQHSALRALVAHVSGYTAVTPDEAARIIRPCIGLTKPQALANARYREKLKNSIYEAHRKAHPNGSPEKAAQIAERKAQEAAARYAARQHRYRAQNIARTELAFAYNAGAYGATRDAQAQGYIGACVKVWLTAYDERVCPICSAMDDEKRSMDEPFSNGSLLPPAHPSCRCAVAYEEISNTNLNPGGNNDIINEQAEESASTAAGQNIIPLPRYEAAVLPDAKFSQYALNPDRAPDKARAFKLALGYDLTNYQDLIANIYRHLPEFPAKMQSDIGYGMRYEVIMQLKGPNGKTAKVLTGWIDDKKTGEMRLTTVHIDD